MLYKKELSAIPIGKMPQIDTGRRDYVATANVVELKRSGKILVVDFFDSKKKSLASRFCTDGKNYCTRNAATGDVWTEQNPRVWMGYFASADREEDRKTAAKFLRYGKTDLLSLVDHFISRQRWDRRQKAIDRKEALQEQHFAMYPPLPDNLASYCETNLFTPYIFISALDKKGHRQGRCSCCGAEFEAPKTARSGQPTRCPVCGRSAVYRAMWIKSDIENKAKICIAAKVDGQILLRWVNVERYFSHPDFRAKYYFDNYAYNLYLHEGKTYFYKWQMCGYYYGRHNWYRGAIGDLCYDTAAVYTDNLQDVFGERYCGVDLKETLAQTNCIIPFAILLKNLKEIPATEYLLKMGMVNLAAAVTSIPGAKECARPSFSGVLGVDGQFAKMYREMDVTYAEHRMIQNYGKWIPKDQFEMFRALGVSSTDTYDKVEKLLQQMSFSRFVNYFTKQLRLNKDRGIGYILTCYRDYIDMSSELGVDMSHKGTRFPKNCVEAHNKITARYNAVKQEIENNRFVDAVKPIYEALRLTAFERGGFCIVLPQKRSDLTTEGQSLNHCVGGETYAKNHMAGTRLIFFVRKISNRAKPFFTMEVDMTDFRICQLYGFGDCSAPPDVRKFAEAFVKKLAPAKVTRKTA